jgi:ABC-type transport system involved in multi-copper enzyme maturation permease subunit
MDSRDEARASKQRRHIGVLLRYDLKYALQSPRGLLFLVFFALFWAYWLQKLGSGFASKLQDPELGMMLGLFFDSTVVRLVREHAPSLVGFYYVALTVTPAFAMLGACDQTANDLGSKHLRFLIPRVGRFEIYLARFLGAATLVSGAQIMVGIAATVISLLVDGGAQGGDPGRVILYGAVVTCSLVAYSISFVALMSILSALMASASLAALIGIGGYAMLVLIIGFVKQQWPAAEYASYLVPSGFKTRMLSPDLGSLALAILAQPVYVGVFLALGWRYFRGRDA